MCGIVYFVDISDIIIICTVYNAGADTNDDCLCYNTSI